MKRIVTGLILGLMLLFSCAMAEPAENLTDLCQITSVNAWKNTGNVHDGQYTSFWPGKSSSEVRDGYLEFQVPAGKTARWLYICFGEEPQNWEIQTEQGGSWETRIVGEMRYAHTLLDLGAETHFRLIDTSGKKTKFKINEVFVFGDGELPGWVQDWQPTQEKADILLLATHPDDELLFFGGTIPDYGVERGLSVVVAYMSYSDTTRKSELLNGLWSMGVRNYPVIGNFHDLYRGTLEAAYQIWKKADVDRYVSGLIRRFKPEVVLSHDVDGEYGHGAHKVCADAALRCSQMAGDPSFCPETADLYGTWEVKKVYLHLAKEQPIHMNWRVPLSTQEGRTGLEAATEAYKLHLTQATTNFVVTDEDKNSCADFGLVFTTVGPDVKGGDFLENIDNVTGNLWREPAKTGAQRETDADETAEIETETVLTEPDSAGQAQAVPAESADQENVQAMPANGTAQTETAAEPEEQKLPLLPIVEFNTDTPAGNGKAEKNSPETAADEPADAAIAENEEALPADSGRWTVKASAPEAIGTRKPYADVEWPAELAGTPRDELGYAQSGEWVIADNDNGLWFYASPTLVVRVDRIFEPEAVLTWYKAKVFCDLDREHFGSILYDPDAPQKKHVQAKLIAKENQVVFGMNTDYYTYRLGRKTMIGVVVRNGKIFFNRAPEANRRQFPNLDTMAMYEDGRWAVYHSDERTAEEYIADGAVDVWCFGPYLIREGEYNPFLKTMKNGFTPQPRAAIGMVRPGQYVMLLAEGRIRNQAVGVDIQFLADHLMEEGCVEALNIDGGQTAVMCFMGEQITRIGSYNGGNTSPRATTELMGIGHSNLIDPNTKSK